MFSEDEPVRSFDRSNRWLGNSCSSHPDQIDRANFRVVASASQHERRNVGRDSTTATDECQLADRRKVMDDAVSRNDRSIVNVNVPAEQHSVDEKRVVKDVAIVSDMRIGHQHVSVTDARPVVLLFGSSADGDSFSEEIVVADFDTGVSVGSEADILRLAANHAVRPETVSLADDDFALHDHVAVEFGAVADRDVGANDAERSNFDIVADPG